MPGTTRYSATFDRTYEEEDRADPSPHANARRSRSLSLQTNSFHDGRLYTPLTGRPPSQRSSSQDNSPVKGPEHIPTRTAKTTVKAHNNPFQFVKVGSCPLYKKVSNAIFRLIQSKPNLEWYSQVYGVSGIWMVSHVLSSQDDLIWYDLTVPVSFEHLLLYHRRLNTVLWLAGVWLDQNFRSSCCPITGEFNNGIWERRVKISFLIHHNAN